MLSRDLFTCVWLLAKATCLLTYACLVILYSHECNLKHFLTCSAFASLVKHDQCLLPGVFKVVDSVDGVVNGLDALVYTLYIIYKYLISK